jgi:hypothetical protein
MMDATEERIRDLARSVNRNPEIIGKLSTGECIAMALLFNKPEWLPKGYEHPLDAIKRLGENWLAALQNVFEDGWE